MRRHLRSIPWLGLLLACTPVKQPKGSVERAPEPASPAVEKAPDPKAAEEEKAKGPDAPKSSGPKSLKFATQTCEKNGGACYTVDASLNEMSGIVASPSGPFFWVHNDEGPGIVYALNLRGEI